MLKPVTVKVELIKKSFLGSRPNNGHLFLFSIDIISDKDYLERENERIIKVLLH